MSTYAWGIGKLGVEANKSSSSEKFSFLISGKDRIIIYIFNM